MKVGHLLDACQIVLRGKTFFNLDGTSRFERRGSIISTDRHRLQCMFLDQAAKVGKGKLQFHFNQRILNISTANSKSRIVSQSCNNGELALVEVECDLLVGADGTSSVVRRHLMDTTGMKCDIAEDSVQYKWGHISANSIAAVDSSNTKAAKLDFTVINQFTAGGIHLICANILVLFLTTTTHLALVQGGHSSTQCPRLMEVST